MLPSKFLTLTSANFCIKTANMEDFMALLMKKKQLFVTCYPEKRLDSNESKVIGS